METRSPSPLGRASPRDAGARALGYITGKNVVLSSRASPRLRPPRWRWAYSPTLTRSFETRVPWRTARPWRRRRLLRRRRPPLRGRLRPRPRRRVFPRPARPPVQGLHLRRLAQGGARDGRRARRRRRRHTHGRRRPRALDRLRVPLGRRHRRPQLRTPERRRSPRARLRRRWTRRKSPGAGSAWTAGPTLAAAHAWSNSDEFRRAVAESVPQSCQGDVPATRRRRGGDERGCGGRSVARVPRRGGERSPEVTTHGAGDERGWETRMVRKRDRGAARDGR